MPGSEATPERDPPPRDPDLSDFVTLRLLLDRTWSSAPAAAVWMPWCNPEVSKFSSIYSISLLISLLYSFLYGISETIDTFSFTEISFVSALGLVSEVFFSIVFYIVDACSIGIYWVLFWAVAIDSSVGFFKSSSVACSRLFRLTYSFSIVGDTISGFTIFTARLLRYLTDDFDRFETFDTWLALTSWRSAVFSPSVPVILLSVLN